MKKIFLLSVLTISGFVHAGNAFSRPACTTVIVPAVYIAIDGLDDESFAKVSPVLTETGKDEALDLLSIEHNYQSETVKAGAYTIALKDGDETLVTKDVVVKSGACHTNTEMVTFTCSVKTLENNAARQVELKDQDQVSSIVCE